MSTEVFHEVPQEEGSIARFLRRGKELLVSYTSSQEMSSIKVGESRELDEEQFLALKKQVDGLFLQLQKKDPATYNVQWYMRELEQFEDTHKNTADALTDFKGLLESLLK